ncbi:MAG: AsmA family protein [Ignavibacteriales bacterium]|nr:AsmA family protein [Ignavibacteriales bacterium]
MRKFFRTTYALAVIVLFVVVAVLGFTQTKVFRSYLRTRLIETVASGIHADLTLGEIEGNLFTGFHAENVVLSRDGDSLLTVKRVDAKYDPLSLLAKNVSVSRITLTSPVIDLKRSKQGMWNVEPLFRSSSKDSTSSSWTINLKQIQILQGKVHLFDSLDLAAREADSSLQIWPGRIDYANLDLDSLHLDAGLHIHSRRIQLALRSFACNLLQPRFQIRELTGDFLLAPATVAVQKLSLLTGRSHVKLDARLDSVDITGVKDLAQLELAPLSAHLSIGRLDFGELKQFVGRPVAFLEQEVAGQVDIEGRFGSMDVRNVTLHTGATSVRIAGTLTNSHHPQDLELDLACVRNRIDPDDIHRLMPTLRLPDLSAFGPVEYDLRFKGKPLAFNVRVASSSRVGNIDVDGTLDLREPLISYDGVLRTSDFNLARLAGDSSLVSRIRSTITFQGRGVRLSEMTGVVRAEIDSSDFYGLPLTRSIVVVDVVDRTVRPRVSLHLGSARIDLGGTLQMKPKDLVGYDISGRINSLNLADITKNDDHTSDISFDVQAQGDLKSLRAISGRGALNVFRSSIDTVQFAGGPAAIRINTLDASPQTLSVTSDIFDLDVNGRFTPATVATALVRGGTLIGEAIAYRINSLDALRNAAGDQQAVKDFHTMVSSIRDTVDYSFSVNLKDCYPIGIALGRELEGSLGINGRVREEAQGIQLSAKAKVEVFRYGDEKLNLGMEMGTVSFSADGLSTRDLLHSMKLSLGAKAKRFDVQGLQTANLAIDLNMLADSSHFAVEAMLDSVVTVRGRGSAHYVDRLFAFTLDRLQAQFTSHDFINSGPVIFKVGKDGLQISNFLLHHEDEEVSVAGLFNSGGTSNLAASVHNVLVNNIPKVVRRTASIESLPPMSGIVNANATFDGSLEKPRFSLDMNATGVHYQQRPFGTVQIRSSYADRLLTIFAQLQSQPDSMTSTPELLVNGTVPYDLSLTGESNGKLEGEMNLDVQSKDFRLEFLDPFIPELSNLSGHLVCDVKLRGTVESPAYAGSMVIQNARFLFDPLGIQYLVDGRLVPNGRQIAFENATVRNIPEDRPDGKLNLSGSFSLEGLKIKDFDLVANGQLLVMKESARRSNQGLYGDLVPGTGPLGITWKGSPSRSFVSGEVFTKYANLTLPPAVQTQDLPNRSIEVKVIDDLKKDSASTQMKEGQSGPAVKTATLRSAKALAAVQEEPAPSQKSFLDNIVYNLAIETQGVTQLRFVFSNFTNEQLLAELKGRTVFTRDGDQMHLTGELELGNRSYYNNFKKLDATGRVNFTGDPVNPELDVVATYEGVGTRGPSGSSKVVVKVFITGTRDQPKVKMGLAEYDQLGNLMKERPDKEGDAIAFLVTGSFRDELTQQDKLSLAGSSVLGGVASSILSGPLTDLLRKEFGIVRSVDVLYYGGGTLQESADVRLTGELGDAVFRLGGRVLSDLNNTNISMQLPMSAIVGSEKWRNLVLEAERTVQGIETVDQRRESKGVRLLYRIIF